MDWCQCWGVMEMGDEGMFYPEMTSLTDRQLEEELDKGRIYRLNDRFFKEALIKSVLPS